MNRILALSLALALPAGAAPAAIDADLVNEATVLLKAAHAGGSTEVGSGVVVCVKDGHASILTARHVLESKPGKRARGRSPSATRAGSPWVPASPPSAIPWICRPNGSSARAISARRANSWNTTPR